MDYLKLVVKGRTFSTIEWRNVFYFSVATMPTVAELTTDMPGWIDGFYNPILEDISSVAAVYAYDVHKWKPDTTTWDWVMSGNKTKAGTASSDPSPSQIAVVLVAYTAVKRVFSRKFICGANDLTFTGNTILAATLARMSTTLVFWLSNYTAPSNKIYVPGTWTKNENFAGFVQGVVNSIAGTMRRRKAGVGI